MSLRNKIIVITLAVLVLGGGTWFFIHLSRIKTPAGPALQGIPVNAFCVIETRQSPGTWKKLSQDNIIWDDLCSADAFRKITSTGKLIDSLLKKKTELYGALNNNPLFCSLHCTGNDKVNYVFSISLPGPGWENDARLFARETWVKPLAIAKWKDIDIESSTEAKTPFHFCVARSVLVISDNVELVKTAIDQLLSGKSLQQDKAFNAVMSTAGDNVDANVFVNYAQLPVLVKRQTNDDFTGGAEGLGRLAAWTEIDATLKPNAVRLNGFTSADSAKYYLSVFRKQQPQRIELTSVLPGTSTNFVFYGVSNFRQLMADYDSYLGASGVAHERHQQLDKMERTFGKKLVDNFSEWMGNEYAWVMDGDDPTENCFAVFATNNIGLAKQSLGSMSNLRLDTISIDTASYQGYALKRINGDGILPALLGSPFDALTQNWYTSVRQYIVFANSPDALHRFIDAYESGKTLGNDRFFKDFSDNLGPETNLYLWSAIGKTQGLLRRFASPGFAGVLSDQLVNFSKMEGLGVQYSSGTNGLFYNNVFLRRGAGEQQVTGTLWETELDTAVAGKPQLVVNHNTKGLEIFVQDKNNTIYLISNTGKILWRKTMPAPVMSEVQQVDALKNNKLQLVFNTSDFIYALDRNGNPLTGFPIKLPAPATNPVRVIDYDNNREYRMLIACNDKHVYNYDIKGKKVDGWKFGSTQDVVNAPVQHTVVGGKDYVIIADRAGRLSVVDRQGSTRLKLKERLSAPLLSFTIDNGSDLSKTWMVSADSLGNITKLSLSDELENVHIQSFAAPQLFEYRDVTGDGVREYIFLDSSRLSVFGQNKQPVLTNSFTGGTLGKPLVFAFGATDVRIGVVCDHSNALHLLRSNGSESGGFPLFGNTPFSIGSLNNDNHYVLIAGGKNKFVYAYPVQ